jgi:hypothetical protein
VDAWTAMFTVRLGITPDRIADLSVMAMVDHVEYLKEAGSDG